MKTIQSVIPLVDRLYNHCKPISSGIPHPEVEPFVSANSDTFAVSVTSVTGEKYHVGDSQSTFPILSIAKPFVYGLVLRERGIDSVLETMNVEPTGGDFNQFLVEEQLENRMYNPMINAGAMMITSMIPGKNVEQKAEQLSNWIHSLTGENPILNTAYMEHRKKEDCMLHAMGYALKHANLLAGDMDDLVALYARQCSFMVSAESLSMLASILANGGTHPISGDRIFSSEEVQRVLSVMYSCGLYTHSGNWIYQVGLPAKSGLAGALLVIIPGQLGVALYSPPLGSHNKSVRGIEFFSQWKFHSNEHIFRSTLSSRTSSLPKHETWFAPRIKRETLKQAIHTCFDNHNENYEGSVYQAEPNLSNPSLDDFAVSLVGVSGERINLGDVHVPFLIQSISKVFAHGLALEDTGRDYVLSRVGVDPTGYSYNSMIRVQQKSKRPYNPMVNTGAISISSMIRGNSPAKRLQRILEMYQRYCGHTVNVDMPTYISEQNRGDRNWAIAYLLRSFGMIDGNIEQTLDLYLQQCSVKFTNEDLALMAATLANGGQNPQSGVQALSEEYVLDVLSVMSSCGMYDYSGRWMYNVGYPAKSGVGGGLIVVVPNVMGISVYSPLLDTRGNSIRGIAFCEELFSRLNLHSMRIDPYMDS